MRARAVARVRVVVISTCVNARDLASRNKPSACALDYFGRCMRAIVREYSHMRRTRCARRAHARMCR